MKIYALFSEPFLEAVPTTFILLAIYFRDRYIFGGSERNFLGIQKWLMFWITFGISVFSGSLGMAKFLKLGPCKIVPSDKFHCGFVLVIFSIATSMVGKGLVLASSLSGEYRDYLIIVLIWICSCILPQLIFVST